MSLFLQIVICIWIIFTVAVIIGYSASVSNKNFTGLVNIINTSETLNLFGKILSNLLYLLPRIENPGCDPFLGDFEVSRDLNKERASEFVVDDLASYDYGEGTKFIIFNKEEISEMIKHLQTALKYLNYYGEIN